VETQSIEKVLISLVEMYDDESEQISNDLLCKMAALELCGWLEEIHDKLILSSLDLMHPLAQGGRNHDFTKFKNDVTKKINNMHGLSYSDHLRTLLEKLLGPFLVLKLEHDIIEIDKLRSELDSLHEYRNQLAHTSLCGIEQQQTLYAPNVILNKFRIIYSVLIQVEDYLLNGTILK
jgi:hypothetical protein